MNYASIILNMNRLQPNEMMRELSNGPQEKLVSLNNKLHVTSLTRLKAGWHCFEKTAILGKLCLIACVIFLLLISQTHTMMKDIVTKKVT